MAWPSPGVSRALVYLLQTAARETVCMRLVCVAPPKYVPFFVLRVMLSPVLEEVIVCLRVSPPTLRQVDPNIAFLRFCCVFLGRKIDLNATQLETRI